MQQQRDAHFSKVLVQGVAPDGGAQLHQHQRRIDLASSHSGRDGVGAGAGSAVTGCCGAGCMGTRRCGRRCAGARDCRRLPEGAAVNQEVHQAAVAALGGERQRALAVGRACMQVGAGAEELAGGGHGAGGSGGRERCAACGVVRQRAIARHARGEQHAQRFAVPGSCRLVQGQDGPGIGLAGAGAAGRVLNAESSGAASCRAPMPALPQRPSPRPRSISTSRISPWQPHLGHG